MQFSARELEKLTMTVPDMLRNAQASTRTFTVLRQDNHMFAAQLLAYTPQDLRRIHNVGNAVYRDIVRVITAHGFRVGALQDYTRELLYQVPSACTDFFKHAAVPQQDDVIDINAVKARQAFGEHLLAIKEHSGRPHLYCNTRNVSEWLEDCLPESLRRCISITPEFLGAVFDNPVSVGNAGLHLPFGSKRAEAGLRLS